VLDDRLERPGVKLNDADLAGIPFRIVVGKKVPDGLVELSERSTRQTGDVKIEEVVALLRQKLVAAKA
jgi:prolyl-tRNA synthetase